MYGSVMDAIDIDSVSGLVALIVLVILPPDILVMAPFILVIAHFVVLLAALRSILVRAPFTLVYPITV